jgi:hypothetical protein
LFDETRVNDIPDIRDGERGLSDICCENDFTTVFRGFDEGVRLLLSSLCSIQRDNHHGGYWSFLGDFGEFFETLSGCGFAFFKTCQKGKDIA